MLKDQTYDLMETASVLSKGLHRYDTFRKDAAHCAQCQEIWAYMKNRDEEELKRVVDYPERDILGPRGGRRRRAGPARQARRRVDHAELEAGR